MSISLPSNMLYNEYKLAHQHVAITQFESKPPNCIKWKPPDEGILKLNCDAAVDENGKNEVGFIARMHSGDMLYAGSRQVQDSDSAEMVESESLRWAMQEGLRMSVPRIIVESDCHALITKLLHGTGLKGEYGRLLNTIWSDAAKFESCEWSYDIIYAVAMSPVVPFMSYFISNLPKHLVDVILADMT